MWQRFLPPFTGGQGGRVTDEERARTESGRHIEGIVFQDEPWIGWEWKTRTAFCERCGEVTEVPLAFYHAGITRRLSRFHARHRGCDGTVKPYVEDDRTDLKVGQPRIQGETINRVVFRAGNHVVTVLPRVVEGFIHYNPVVGVPAGIPFEVRGADPMGAWLYGPGYGMDPEGMGPLRISWEMDWAADTGEDLDDEEG
jgi:hypothetical protein